MGKRKRGKARKKGRRGGGHESGEARKQGSMVAYKQGNKYQARKQGSREAEKPGSGDVGKQGSREMENHGSGEVGNRDQRQAETRIR